MYNRRKQKSTNFLLTRQESYESPFTVEKEVYIPEPVAPAENEQGGFDSEEEELISERDKMREEKKKKQPGTKLLKKMKRDIEARNLKRKLAKNIQISINQVIS